MALFLSLSLRGIRKSDKRFADLNESGTKKIEAAPEKETLKNVYVG